MLVDRVFSNSITDPYENMFYYPFKYKPSFWFESSKKVVDSYRKEDEKEFSIDVVLPGFNKEDIQVKMVSNTGAVMKNYLYVYITSKNKSMSFLLPDNLDFGSATAKYEQGILKVKVPKIEKSNEEVNEVKVE